MSEELLTIPLLALRGMVILPGMITNIDIGRDKSIAAVNAVIGNAVMGAEKKILLAAQKDASMTEITAADVYMFAVLAQIKQQVRLPNGAVRLLVEGLERVQLTDVTEVHYKDRDYFVGQGRIMSAAQDSSVETEALRRLLLEAFEKWALLTKKAGGEVVQALKEQSDAGRVADMMTGYLMLSLPEKQQLLETVDVQLRLHLLYEMMTREQESILVLSLGL